MILYFIDFLFIALDYTLYTLLFSRFMRKKRTAGLICMIGFIFTASLVDLLSGTLQIHLLALLTNAGLLLLLSYLLFEGNLKIRLVICSLCLLFSFILEMASGFFWATFFGIEAVALIDYPQHMLLASAFYVAVKMVIVLILSRIPAEENGSEMASAFQIKMALVPIFSLLGIFLSGYQFLVKEEPDYLAVVTVGLIVGFLNILYFMVLRAHTKLYEENLKNAMSAREYEMREEYYQMLEQQQLEIRRVKHDLKNQLLAISGSMNDSENGRAGEQITLILEELQGQEQIHFTGHKGLNVLLGSKYRKAQAEQISCDFQIKVPENLPMDEKDLGTLMGNILDNAVEGCLHCPRSQRYIRLKMVFFKNSLVIQAENSADGQAKDLRTRKKDTLNHGLGTGSIRNIAEQYHGSMDYQIENDHFQLDITLWLSK